MAHIQNKYSKLWKPQDLAIDKINSQRMFVDNIDELETFVLSTLKKSSIPVASLTELRDIDTSDIMLYVTGMTVMVRSNGLYFFDRTSTVADNNDTIIAPTTGGGRWISNKTFLGNLAFKNSLSKTDVGLGNVPNVSTNDQTPTYTQSATLVNLVSGEKLSISMGKIMKAIVDFISHLANRTNPHNVTATQVGLDNVPNVATNDQTPTYTEAAALTTLTSGEKLSISMGKIMKAIADLINHIANKSNPHEVTKAQIGLGNVDNTSDLNKPVSTAQAIAIADAKKAGTDAGTASNTVQTNLTSHINTKTNPHNVTATQVGLGNVPNVATNDQTPTYTTAGTLTALSSGEKLSISMGKIAKAIIDLISHIANKTNPHGVTKSQIGLGNVDNTSDLNKPVSTAMQTQLDYKAPAKFISTYTEVNSWNALNTFLDNTLVNDMTNNSIKYVAVLLTADIGPFYHRGTVHFKIHRVSDLHGSVIATKYGDSPNEVRFYSRNKYDGGWGNWITYPTVSSVVPASVE